jgi:hypothetical protein
MKFCYKALLIYREYLSFDISSRREMQKYYIIFEERSIQVKLKEENINKFVWVLFKISSFSVPNADLMCGPY